MRKYIFTESQVKRLVDDLILEKRVLRESQKSLKSVIPKKSHTQRVDKN